MNTAIKKIESKENSTYKEFLEIKKGKKDGVILIEGEDLIEEAISENKLIALLCDDLNKVKVKNVPIYILKENLYKNLSSFKSLPPAMGIAEKEMTTDFGDKVIYLDRVQDPGNAGTMIRTALSFGYSSLVLSKDSVSLYNSKTIQSSKGALFHLPIGREDLILFKERGYHIYLTSLDGEDERAFHSLEKPFVLVFGNEGQGVRKENLELGEKLRIEMSGIDSLNVAVAAGILMYRFKED